MKTRHEIIADLQSQGIVSSEIKEEDLILRSFNELYAIDIDTKIATEAQMEKFEEELKSALMQIAEMFYDHMLGNEMQKTMIFDIVENVLESAKNKIHIIKPE